MSSSSRISVLSRLLGSLCSLHTNPIDTDVKAALVSLLHTSPTDGLSNKDFKTTKCINNKQPAKITISGSTIYKSN